jgi:hypothetical protein
MTLELRNVQNVRAYPYISYRPWMEGLAAALDAEPCIRYVIKLVPNSQTGAERGIASHQQVGP